MPKHSKLFRIRTLWLGGVILSTVLTSFIAMYAWYSAARAATLDTGGFIAVDSSPAFDKVTIHKPLDSITTASPYQYNSTAVGTYTYDETSRSYVFSGDTTETDGRNVYDMGTYDSLAVPQTLLYLFHIRSNASFGMGFSISAVNSTAETSSLFYGANDMPSNLLQNTGNPLSNIIYYKTVTGLSAATYTFEYSSDDTTLQHFVTLDSATGFLAADGYKTSLSLFSGADPSSYQDQYIAVIIGYDSELMDDLFTINLNNSALTADVISFSNDWKFSV